MARRKILGCVLGFPAATNYSVAIEIVALAKYMVMHRKPPSQTWRTFPENHVKDLVSVDFFVVPTVTFRILYVFFA